MHTVKKTAVLLFLAMFGAMSANVLANAQEARMSVDVPFDFVVGQSRLAAGAYNLQRQGDSVLIRNADGHSVYAPLLAGRAVSSQDENPHLIFRRFGSEAFLDSVIFSEDQNYDLAQTSEEKELMARLRSGEEVALRMQ